MRKDKQITPEETAKKLQSMVSLGIPDTNFSVQRSQTASDERFPENEALPESAKKVDSATKEVSQPEQISTPTRRKRKENPEGYRDVYFRRVDFSDRQPLYITRLTHEKLMMIVNLIGGRKATISSYVENILLQHLESNREELNRLFDENYLKNRSEF
jgi:hypothetical protein